MPTTAARPSRVPSLLIAAPIAATLAGCGMSWMDAPYKETRRTEAAHVAGAGIEVKTANGGVTVRRVDGEVVTIEAALRARTQERLEAATIVAERRPDQTLFVTVKWPDDKRLDSEGCTFDIAAPGAFGVTIDTSNGAIRIAGLTGAAHLDTSNGSISVDGHDGAVKADTSNGRITLSDVTGDAHVDTSNGGIVIDNLHGVLVADTSNGPVKASLADDARGPVTVSTSNGGVTLTLGPAFVGQLSVATSNAGVRIGEGANVKVQASGKASAVIDVGAGGEKSVVRTSNGGVDVNFRRK